ncbi:hypothetical protein DFH07DRAFT_1054480 [Mycena maculata]|uniref:F-box domain-containing protein n=1 Tax=Mycena maculata TaxID=230809 RepID=A0AAD7P2M0_9AGAR|nr:hypothetical protein DFH07DRAFT_1054480 [Mycena maculata]
MTPLLDFPPELEDLIVDHMRGQNDALATCGLVSRSWLRSSRLHLFGTVTLRDRTWEKFLQLLDSPLSTVVQSVRTLAISRSEDDLDLGAFFEALIHQLPVFPSLTRLRISHAYWAGVSMATVDSLVQMFANITALDLHLVTFDTPHELAALISCFTRLRGMSLYTPFLDSGSSGRTTDLPLAPSTLELVRFRSGPSSGDPPGHFIAWLHAGDQPPAIRSLELGILAATSLPSVGALLHALGPELHDLDLAFMYHVSAVDIGSYIDLSQNTNLRGLTIHLSLRRFRSPTAVRLGSWALLAAVRSGLTTLTIVLSLDTIAVLDNLDSAHFIATLEQPQFATLQRLHFIVHPFVAAAYTVDGEMEGAIRKRLTGDAARGIVDIDVVHTSRVFTQGVL